MIILTIRTDKPEAELGVYDDQQQLGYVSWQAHRVLAETLHKQIGDILAASNMTTKDLIGIVAYKGPGSFTGLRIGLTVANATAYAQGIPIVSETGEDWIMQGIARLKAGDNETVAMPEYGADAHITKQKH